ncbi:glutathione S-transferase [Yoonia sp. SS1-5]|uniref:Glutathione S-transferase n=1 Tax=Yoonia rhodophyticola TaxID=3137370 RepID=A0AAN0MB20_9RHOB
MFRLHYAPGTISVAVAIALERTGTAYAPVLVDFAQAAQTTATYHQVNPKGRVPALETPQGILTETGALLEFVAPDLVPTDPFAAARMRELMCYLNGTMHPNHAHGARGNRWADDPQSLADMKRKVPQTMAASCAYLDQMLPDLPFGTGAFDVVSDAYLFVVLTWLNADGVDIATYPTLAAFQRQMDAHPAVKAVRAKGMLA